MGKIVNILFNLVSDEYGGSRGSVPLNGKTITIEDKISGVENVFGFLNDSFEIWFGYPTSWQFHMRRKTFHKMVLWYLKKWAFSEWFGLRRKLFYFLLTMKIKKY